MLQLSTNWLAAFSQPSCSPDIFVEIFFDSATYFRFTSTVGSRISNATTNIDSVTAISPKLDPIERGVQTSTVTITFVDDGILRALVASRPIRTARITIKLGETSLDENDYAPYFCGIVQDILPIAGTAIELTCVDAFKALAAAKYAGNFVAKHPLEVIRLLITNSGIPYGLREDSAFDPAKYPDIRHYNMNFNNSPPEDENDPTANAPEVLKAIEEIARVLNGSVFVDETGKITFRRLDLLAQPIAHWSSDVIDKPVKQNSCLQNTIRTVRIGLHPADSPDSPDTLLVGVQSEDDFVGGTTKEIHFDIFPMRASLSPFPSSFLLGGIDVAGFCGVRATVNPDNTVLQEPYDALTPNNVLYL